MESPPRFRAFFGILLAGAFSVAAQEPQTPAPPESAVSQLQTGIHILDAVRQGAAPLQDEAVLKALGNLSAPLKQLDPLAPSSIPWQREAGKVSASVSSLILQEETYAKTRGSIAAADRPDGGVTEHDLLPGKLAELSKQCNDLLALLKAAQRLAPAAPAAAGRTKTKTHASPPPAKREDLAAASQRVASVAQRLGEVGMDYAADKSAGKGAGPAVAAGASGFTREGQADAPIKEKGLVVNDVPALEALSEKPVDLAPKGLGDALSESASAAASAVLGQPSVGLLSGGAAPALQKRLGVNAQRRQLLRQSLAVEVDWLKANAQKLGLTGQQLQSYLSEFDAAQTLKPNAERYKLLSLKARMDKLMGRSESAKAFAQKQKLDAQAMSLNGALLRELSGKVDVQRLLALQGRDPESLNEDELGEMERLQGELQASSAYQRYRTEMGLLQEQAKEPVDALRSDPLFLASQAAWAEYMAFNNMHLDDFPEGTELASQETGSGYGYTMLGRGRVRMHGKAPWPKMVGSMKDGRFVLEKIENEDGSSESPSEDKTPGIFKTADKGGQATGWRFDGRLVSGVKDRKMRDALVDKLAASLLSQAQPNLSEKEKKYRSETVAALLKDQFRYPPKGMQISVSMDPQGRLLITKFTKDGITGQLLCVFEPTGTGWPVGQGVPDLGLTTYVRGGGKDEDFTRTVQYIGKYAKETFSTRFKENSDEWTTVFTGATATETPVIRRLYRKELADGNVEWEDRGEKVEKEAVVVYEGKGMLGTTGDAVATLGKGTVDLVGAGMAVSLAFSPAYLGFLAATGNGSLEDIEFARQDLLDRAKVNFFNNAISNELRGGDGSESNDLGFDQRLRIQNVGAEMKSRGYAVSGAVLQGGVNFANNVVPMLIQLKGLQVLGAAGNLGKGSSVALGLYMSATSGWHFGRSADDFGHALVNYDSRNPDSVDRLAAATEVFTDQMLNLPMMFGGLEHVYGKGAKARAAAPAKAAAAPPPQPTGPPSRLAKMAAAVKALDAKIPEIFGSKALNPSRFEAGEWINRELGMSTPEAIQVRSEQRALDRMAEYLEKSGKPELAAEFRNVVDRDAGTGAYNRQFLDRNAPQFLSKSKNGALSISDINNASSVVNHFIETYGPVRGKQMGDQFLAHYGAMRQTLAKEFNVIDARLSPRGEEFATLGESADVRGFLKAVKEATDGGKVLKELGYSEHDIQGIQKKLIERRGEIQDVGGFTVGIIEGKNYHVALEAADRGLLKGKEVGRGSVVEVKVQPDNSLAFKFAELPELAGRQPSAQTGKPVTPRTDRVRALKVLKEALPKDSFAKLEEIAFRDSTGARTQDYLAYATDNFSKIPDIDEPIRFGSSGFLIVRKGKIVALDWRDLQVANLSGHPVGDAGLAAPAAALKEILAKNKNAEPLDIATLVRERMRAELPKAVGEKALVEMKARIEEMRGEALPEEWSSSYRVAESPIKMIDGRPDILGSLNEVMLKVERSKQHDLEVLANRRKGSRAEKSEPAPEFKPEVLPSEPPPPLPKAEGPADGGFLPPPEYRGHYANQANTQFSRAMSQAIETAKSQIDVELKAGRPITPEKLREIMDGVAKARQEAAKAAGDKDWRQFGNSIPESVDGLMDYYTRGTGRPADDFAGKLEDANRLEDHTTWDPITNSPKSRHFSQYDRAKQALGDYPKIEIDGKLYPLSTVMPTGDGTSMQMLHPNFQDMIPLREKAFKLMAEAANTPNISEAAMVEKMGQAYFLLMHATPYTRGSPAIVESFFDALLRAKVGKTLPPKSREPFWDAMFFDPQKQGNYGGKQLLDNFETAPNPASKPAASAVLETAPKTEARLPILAEDQPLAKIVEASDGKASFARFSTYDGEPGRINQDAINLNLDKRYILVADGMGGHAGGEVASRIAKDVVSREIEANIGPQTTPQEARLILQKALIKADYEIKAHAQKHPETKGMGTTLSATVVVKGPNGVDVAVTANIGDSAVFLRRADGTLVLLSRDESFAASQEAKLLTALKRSGADVQRIDRLRKVSPEDIAKARPALDALAKDDKFLRALLDHADKTGKGIDLRAYEVHPQRNKINNALGADVFELNPDNVRQMPVNKGDTLIAVSDGVVDNLGFNRVKAVARVSKTPGKIAETLAAEAKRISTEPRTIKREKAYQKRDDISAVTMVVAEPPPAKPTVAPKAEPPPHHAEGEYWKVVSHQPDPNGQGHLLTAERTGNREGVRADLFEEGLAALAQNLPRLAADLGISYENGRLTYPDVNALNARLDRLHGTEKAAAVRFWSYDGPSGKGGEAPIKDFIARLAYGRGGRGGEVVISAGGGHHFHDLGVHALGYMLLPPEAVNVLVGQARAVADLNRLADEGKLRSPRLKEKIDWWAKRTAERIDAKTADLPGSLLNNREVGADFQLEVLLGKNHSGRGIVEDVLGQSGLEKSEIIELKKLRDSSSKASFSDQDIQAAAKAMKQRMSAYGAGLPIEGTKAPFGGAGKRPDTTDLPGTRPLAPKPEPKPAHQRAASYLSDSRYAPELSNRVREIEATSGQAYWDRQDQFARRADQAWREAGARRESKRNSEVETWPEDKKNRYKKNQDEFDWEKISEIETDRIGVPLDSVKKIKETGGQPLSENTCVRYGIEACAAALGSRLDVQVIKEASGRVLQERYRQQLADAEQALRRSEADGQVEAASLLRKLVEEIKVNLTIPPDRAGLTDPETAATIETLGFQSENLDPHGNVISSYIDKRYDEFRAHSAALRLSVGQQLAAGRPVIVGIEYSGEIHAVTAFEMGKNAFGETIVRVFEPRESKVISRVWDEFQPLSGQTVLAAPTGKPKPADMSFSALRARDNGQEWFSHSGFHTGAGKRFLWIQYEAPGFKAADDLTMPRIYYRASSEQNLSVLGGVVRIVAKDQGIPVNFKYLEKVPNDPASAAQLAQNFNDPNATQFVINFQNMAEARRFDAALSDAIKANDLKLTADANVGGHPTASGGQFRTGYRESASELHTKEAFADLWSGKTQEAPKPKPGAPSTETLLGRLLDQDLGKAFNNRKTLDLLEINGISIDDALIAKNAAIPTRQERVAAAKQQMTDRIAREKAKAGVIPEAEAPTHSDFLANLIADAHEKALCLVGKCDFDQLLKKLRVMRADKKGLDEMGVREALGRGLAGTVLRPATETAKPIDNAVAKAIERNRRETERRLLQDWDKAHQENKARQDPDSAARRPMTKDADQQDVVEQEKTALERIRQKNQPLSPPQYRLSSTKEADRQKRGLDPVTLKSVQKTLRWIEMNPRHPSLKTHKVDLPPAANGAEIWESYVKQSKGGYRVLWHYGPEAGQITVISVVPHLK